MSTTIRLAIESEINSLRSELQKLERLLSQLGDDGGVEPAVKRRGRKSAAEKAETKPAKKVAKRIRLDDATRKSLTEYITKACRAHGKEGASKAEIIKYLDKVGYRHGVNYTDIHLFGTLTALRSGDEPKVTTSGDKAAMRYIAA